MSDKKRETLRALKFTLFSISAGLIQIAVTFLIAHFWITDQDLYWIPYLIGLVYSVVYNFTINRKFTFHSAANVPVAMAKVFAYYCVFTPLSTIGGNYLTETLGWNEYIVLAISMILNFVTEFLFTRFVVYRNQVDNDGSVKENPEAAHASVPNQQP